MFDQHDFRLYIRTGAFALAASALGAIAQPVLAADSSAKVQETYADIEKTFGAVPTFVKQMPAAALPGAWQELKDLELSEDTALSPKTKALISLAVSAQIPCQYCIWADSLAAKAAGATDEEIGEAVGVAAMTRFWSTNFNGLQVDLATYQRELGPLFAGQ